MSACQEGGHCIGSGPKFLVYGACRTNCTTKFEIFPRATKRPDNLSHECGSRVSGAQESRREFCSSSAFFFSKKNTIMAFFGPVSCASEGPTVP